MGFLEKINDWIRSFEELILAYGILVMGGLTIVNVFARNFFNHSLSFATEINEFLIVLVTFLGTSYAARNGRHIRMSAFHDIANPKIQKILTYIVTFGTAAFMYLMTYLASDYVIGIFQQQKMSPVLRVPLGWIWIFVPIGLLMTAIHYTLAFIKNIMEDDVWVSFEEKSEYEDLEDAMAEEDNSVEYTGEY
ncbi:MAG TPA: TRAP transporter small permease [Halanaerobiales bacterium]|nr:TRAP transporter small permease [Halanaerobiales bacterium]